MQIDLNYKYSIYYTGCLKRNGILLCHRFFEALKLYTFYFIGNLHKPKYQLYICTYVHYLRRYNIQRKISQSSINFFNYF